MLSKGRFSVVRSLSLSLKPDFGTYSYGTFRTPVSAVLCRAFAADAAAGGIGGGTEKADGAARTSAPAPFYKRVFGMGKRKEAIERESEQLDLLRTEEEELRAAESEKKERWLSRKRNKSRLHASHRKILKGEAPQVGVKMLWCEEHATRDHVARMVGHFGRTQTGLDPSVAWPTKEEMLDIGEYERVLYDGLSATEMIKKENERQEAEKEAIRLREMELEANMGKMEAELKAWKARIQLKHIHAKNEEEKRSRILAELKQEYGYDINPLDPQFADKITEKEKHYAKLAKETKKKERADKMQRLSEERAQERHLQGSQE